MLRFDEDARRGLHRGQGLEAAGRSHGGVRLPAVPDPGGDMVFGDTASRYVGFESPPPPPNTYPCIMQTKPREA